MPAGIFFIRKYCLSIDGGGDLAGFSQKIQLALVSGECNYFLHVKSTGLMLGGHQLPVLFGI